MKHLRFLVLVLILSPIFLSYNASPVDENRYVPGEILIQLHPETDMQQYSSKNRSMGIKPKELISERMNIWLCEFNSRSRSDKQVLSLLEHCVNKKRF